ncbi:MAG: hypothetical protein ABI053_03890, partial [Lacisediminihabitans sp.]
MVALGHDCANLPHTVVAPTRYWPDVVYLVAQQAQRGRLDPRYRSGHAQTAVDFGTSFSDSFGKSVIRAVVHQLGYPAPELQVRFTDRQGHMDVDYFWRAEHGCRVETGA